MSIQYSLSGLSFCSPYDGKKYGPVDLDELLPMLRSVFGEGGDRADRINLLVNTDRSAVVPAEIFDKDFEKDYLFAKNIVCAEGEIISTSNVGVSVTVFPVDGRLVHILEKTARQVKITHALSPCLSLALKYVGKTKKNVLLAAITDGVFSYAVAGKKSLLAVDCISDGGVKAGTIMEFLHCKYGISRGVVLHDENAVVAESFKRSGMKFSSLADGEYLKLIDEDYQR